MAALKVIAPQIASRASSIARFHREMRLIGRLDHPNVIRAFDADQVGDLLYIVMEYVAGQSLDHVLEERGPLPAAEVVDLMAQAALGLAHAHERGIVHRDVKPSNLFRGEVGQLKILDLGLSALMEADSNASFATAAGRIVGTVHYMSPEQALAMTVDGRSDLYNLGCTMYQLLSGRMPFPGDSVAECLALRIQGRATPITLFRPDLSPRLVELLDKMMARRPEDRFHAAAEAAEALQDLASQEFGARPAAPPPATVPPALRPVESPALPPDIAPPTPAAGELPGPVPSTWSESARFLAARPAAFAVFISLVGLAALGVGFALGHLLAVLER
jgi:eukaryotic-like serine/threonine-protein kinase